MLHKSGAFPTYVTDKDFVSKVTSRTEYAANALHERIGRNVREAIQKNNEIMPEDLPAEPHIKEVRRKVKDAKKQLTSAPDGPPEN